MRVVSVLVRVLRVVRVVRVVVRVAWHLLRAVGAQPIANPDPVPSPNPNLILSPTLTPNPDPDQVRSPSLLRMLEKVRDELNNYYGYTH